MISIDDAGRLIQENVPSFAPESRPLEEAAGCVLRESIRADRDMPPFDRVMMDGIAVKRDALQGARCRIESTQAAGAPPGALQDAAGACVQVMTGAVLPAGCDCVIPYEELEIEETTATIRAPERHAAGQFIHRAGSDRLAGEELLAPGRRLEAPQIAIVAGVGKDRVQVTRAPAVGLVSNGDELVEPGLPVEPHQIRPSSTFGLAAACQRHGLRDTQRYHLPDDPALIRERLAEALASRDLLVISGGVSMGKYDHIPGALEALGVRNVFHKISLRPGKPFWFGVAPEGKPVFALPGNPVSTMVCFYRLVLPALRQALGEKPLPAHQAELGQDLDFAPPLTGFQAVRLEERKALRIAVPLPHQGSGDYASLGASDGFVELEKARDHFPAGTLVPYFPWHPH